MRKRGGRAVSKGDSATFFHKQKGDSEAHGAAKVCTDAALASVLQAASAQRSFGKAVNANSRAYYTLYGRRIAASKLLYKELRQKALITDNHSESPACSLSVLDAVAAHG